MSSKQFQGVSSDRTSANNVARDVDTNRIRHTRRRCAWDWDEQSSGEFQCSVLEEVLTKR